jgi:predicted transcriptional regulator
MKELTRAEEQIMQVLWKLQRAVVHDIIERLPEPRPAYTTVSTIVRILEQKGFVGHKAYGRTHEYFPLVEKESYSRDFLRHFARNYFGNSYQALVSFFAHRDDLNLKELEEIRRLLDETIQSKKSRK